MPWRGRGIWTCGTTISRKQIQCFARSVRTRPNWGPSTYWPWRTTNRRIFATVYSETCISWSALEFFAFPANIVSYPKHSKISTWGWKLSKDMQFYFMMFTGQVVGLLLLLPEKHSTWVCNEPSKQMHQWMRRLLLQLNDLDRYEWVYVASKISDYKWKVV